MSTNKDSFASMNHESAVYIIRVVFTNLSKNSPSFYVSKGDFENRRKHYHSIDVDKEMLKA